MILALNGINKDKVMDYTGMEEFEEYDYVISVWYTHMIKNKEEVKKFMWDFTIMTTL